MMFADIVAADVVALIYGFVAIELWFWILCKNNHLLKAFEYIIVLILMSIIYYISGQEVDNVTVIALCMLTGMILFHLIFGMRNRLRKRIKERGE